MDRGINLYVLMDYFFWFDTINLIEMVHVLRGYRLKFPNRIIALSLKIVLSWQTV